jgi:hypothetical protein
MKRVRYLAGAVPAVAGLVIPMQHAAAATGAVSGRSGARAGMTAASSSGSVSNSPTITSHKTCYKSESVCVYSACGGDVCLSVSAYHRYFVGIIGERVKWTGHATKTFHTRVYFPKYDTVVGSKTLTFDTGTHAWSWSLQAVQPYPGDKFCAGATGTPGYPCIHLPS